VFGVEWLPSYKRKEYKQEPCMWMQIKSYDSPDDVLRKSLQISVDGRLLQIERLSKSLTQLRCILQNDNDTSSKDGFCKDKEVSVDIEER